jgi:hypothetical protein
MFTKVPILMRVTDKQTRIIAGLLSVNHIVSVFSCEDGKLSSVLMSSSDKVTVNIPYEEFAVRLLELRTETPT